MTSIHRSRKEAKNYLRYMRSLRERGNPCQFCEMSEDDKKVLTTTKHFLVVRNLIPYTFWDDHSVTDHLLVLPRKHTDTIQDFSDEAALEYFRLIADYEQQGYSIYARPPRAATKSVAHQHTHLIKISPRMQKIVIYLQKPHIRVMK